MVSPAQKDLVVSAVLQGSAIWKAAFNCGDANGCAAQYEADAVMHARPFGTFTGTAEIAEFWQKIMNDGFAAVEYLDQTIAVIDANSAVLSANWKMNQASGLIHQELWVLQPDGTAKLREDDFEVTGE
ncbi:nuclear transport factor 2 family protein [filamentous cyanobacterium LEGE 11480]|uniref:Nuclear transport factor 2 family protein n=1 Tax=Romeriopsis navalis LEGE 11480 TaxID=2777977 RepID=A0A928VPA8_9CYAN|nr:nuclear transport factor 2 family protein [Romeriopsis navalis]MBE9030145.1 nuclear transport factor 2 family protein [Romeriopsis navalis LEGE 11480]